MPGAPAAPVLGIPEVDDDLGGALPPGWVGIVMGQSGSGLPLFAKQFAHAGAGVIPVRYYTTYERTADILRAFADFEWKVDGVEIVNLSDEYFDRVLRRDLEVSRVRERGLTYHDLVGGPPPNDRPRTYNLTNRLLSDLAAQESSFRLVVDSLDFFLEVLDPSEVMSMVRQVRHRVQALGGQALLLMQSDVHDRRTTGLLEDLADLVVELRSDRHGDAYEQQLAIRKLRNHPEKTRVTLARMTPRGFVVATGGSATADARGR